MNIKKSRAEERKRKINYLWDFLEPGMRGTENGRMKTAWGTKTPLGLYLSIKTIMEGKEGRDY